MFSQFPLHWFPAIVGVQLFDVSKQQNIERLSPFLSLWPIGVMVVELPPLTAGAESDASSGASFSNVALLTLIVTPDTSGIAVWDELALVEGKGLVVEPFAT